MKTTHGNDERHSGSMNVTQRRGAAVAAGGTALALALGMLAAGGASAAPEPDDQAYSVTASESTVTIGDEVDVTVAAASVNDLYAYSVDLGYDPELLQYVGDSAATDISGATYEKVTAGEVEVTHTKLGTSPATSAEGVTLVTATFKAISDGPATITASDFTAVSTGVESTTTPVVGSTVVGIDKIAAPVATKAPSISGSARVGSVLTVTPGAWDVDGLRFTYQWISGGAAIPGATGASYRVAPSTEGARLTVKVVASRTGYEDGVSTATSGIVAKASTKTSLTAKDRSIKRGKKLVTTVRVTASGAVPTGTLTYKYRGKITRQHVTLVNGKATVTFRPGAVGRHTLRVTFVPSKGFKASTDTLSIRVKKK